MSSLTFSQIPSYVSVYLVLISLLTSNVFSADGTESIEIKETGSKRNPKKLGIKTANLLLKAGAMKLAEGWRDAVEAWNSK